MKNDSILVQIEDGIATVTINRPARKNSLDHGAVAGLREAEERLGKDNNVRVVIITGAGEDAFCTGADLRSTEVTFKDFGDCIQRMRDDIRVFPNIRRMPQPVIAAINGVAAGGGCVLALYCDIRIASEKARFRPGFGAIGFIPEGGSTQVLPRVVGMPKAMELMLTNDIIDAREAERIGLVNMVVPPGELMTAARAMAKKIIHSAPLVAPLVKSALYQGQLTDVDTALEREGMTNAMLRQTDDFEEGVKALLGKRKPKFKGK